MLTGFDDGRNPMMRGVHQLALSGALLLAAAPAMAANTGATHKQPAPPTASARRDDKALLSFQRDLVSVLAARAEAMPLLGAALLARPLVNPPKTSSFHSLIGRAAMADGSPGTKAAVSWLRLADCSGKADTCPNASALQALQTEAPDNAAVWLLQLGVDMHDMKSAAVRSDLAKAAAATVYDDYTGISLKALADSAGVLPAPADLLGAQPGAGAGAAGIQLVLVYGLASAQPQPSLPVVAKLCEKSGDDASIKADCLKLGKLLEWGSSPLSRSLGLHLAEVLSSDPSQQDSIRHARSNLVWQVQNFGQLLTRAQGDAPMAQRLLGLARNGGTEMSLLLAALRDNHIPTDAPNGWQPAKAD